MIDFVLILAKPHNKLYNVENIFVSLLSTSKIYIVLQFYNSLQFLKTEVHINCHTNDASSFNFFILQRSKFNLKRNDFLVVKVKINTNKIMLGNC